jgi:hypothetical protein
MDMPTMICHRSWVGTAISVAGTKQVVNQARENWVNSRINRESAFGSRRYRQRPLNGCRCGFVKSNGID